MTSAAALAEESPRLQAGGTLNPRRHLYLKRPQDEEFLELLLDGQYVNLLTSRQMGKSSLMIRAAHALAAQGVRTASVDLAAELGTPADAGSYFLGLLTSIARDLRVNIELETWWQRRGSETVNQRLIRFFGEIAAEQIDEPVVIFLDEIDSTLKFPYTDDLFTALRGMHNERATVPAYERFTFCLIGVTTPNELIKDQRTTPYNVGRTLELRDFDPCQDDLTSLEQALCSDPEPGRTMLKRVLHWTGGHPYLTLRLCASLREIDASTPEDVDRRVEDSFRSLERVSNDVHFQQILRFLETRLADGLATFNLYQRILDGKRERDQTTPAHMELKLSGLVKRDEEGCLIVRNRIYHRLFDGRWVEGTKPKRMLERTRRLAIAASIALLLGAVVAGGYIAYLQMRLGERQQLEALNVTITSASNRTGTRIELPDGASQELLEQAVPLLKAVDPVIEIDLSDTHVTEVAPLANLTNLESLDVSGTEIENAAPLASLASLQSLDLSDTRITDVAPLASLGSLQSLDLSGTEIENAAPLASLTYLQSLDLSGTHIADAAPVASITNLQSLGLSDTEVADLPRLSRLTNLLTLRLAGTKVNIVSSLQSLIGLQRLDLVRTPISDLGPLRNLVNLEWLDIGGTNVSDLSPIQHLDKLTYLGIGGGSVAVYELYPITVSLEADQKWPSNGTRTFDTISAPVSDIEALTNLKHLQWLDLNRTKITNLNPLSDLQQLLGIDLDGTPIVDVSPLAKIPALQMLKLSNTQVAEVAPLANLTGLQRLDLSGTQVSQEQMTQLKRALAERGNFSVEISGP